MSSKFRNIALLLGTTLIVAGLAVVVTPGEGIAQAFPQVLTILSSRTVTDPCCVGLGETVEVDLDPTVPPDPIILTWSADRVNDNQFVVAFKVNGGPCIGVGPGRLDTFPGPGFRATTAQVIFLPVDGVVAGPNTFELCAGRFSTTGTLLLGFRTTTAVACPGCVAGRQP